MMTAFNNSLGFYCRHWNFSRHPNCHQNHGDQANGDLGLNSSDYNGSLHSDEGLGSPDYLLVYFTLASCIVFFAGVIGNLLVIVVVVRIPSMRTRMNYFLVSLSVADLMVLIVCQPVALLDLYTQQRWPLGSFMCKLVPFLENTAVHCSALSLLVVSQERFVAICRPLSVMTRRWIRRRMPTILLIWCLSMVLCAPFAIISDLEKVEYYDHSLQWVCRTKTRLIITRVFLVSQFVLFMVLPLIAITYYFTAILWTMCTLGLPPTEMQLTVGNHNRRSKIRERVVKMTVVVVVLFYACVLPFRTLAVWLVFAPGNSIESIGFDSYMNLVYITRLLTFLNSAANPVIYGLMCTKFRNAFASVLPERCARHIIRSTSDTSSTKMRVFYRQSKSVRSSNEEHSITGLSAKSVTHV